MAVGALSSGVKVVGDFFVTANKVVAHDLHGCERTARLAAKIFEMSGTKAKGWLSAAKEFKVLARLVEGTIAFTLWVDFVKGKGLSSWTEVLNTVSYLAFRTTKLFEHIDGLGESKYYARCCAYVGNLPVISTLIETGKQLPIVRMVIGNPIMAFGVVGMSCGIYNHYLSRQKLIKERALYEQMANTWKAVRQGLDSATSNIEQQFKEEAFGNVDKSPGYALLGKKAQKVETDPLKLAKIVEAQNAFTEIQKINGVYNTFKALQNSAEDKGALKAKAELEMKRWKNLADTASYEIGVTWGLTAVMVAKAAQNVLTLISISWSLPALAASSAFMSAVGFISAFISVCDVWHKVSGKVAPMAQDIRSVEDFMNLQNKVPAAPAQQGNKPVSPVNEVSAASPQPGAQQSPQLQPGLGVAASVAGASV